MATRLTPPPVLVDVLSRCSAALLGGYALSVALPVALGLLLPVSRAQATLTALLLSFAVYTGAFLWAFSARSHWRAWGGLLLPALAGVAISTLMLMTDTGPFS